MLKPGSTAKKQAFHKAMAGTHATKAYATSLASPDRTALASQRPHYLGPPRPATGFVGRRSTTAIVVSLLLCLSAVALFCNGALPDRWLALDAGGPQTPTPALLRLPQQTVSSQAIPQQRPLPHLAAAAAGVLSSAPPAFATGATQTPAANAPSVDLTSEGSVMWWANIDIRGLFVAVLLLGGITFLWIAWSMLWHAARVPSATKGEDPTERAEQFVKDLVQEVKLEQKGTLVELPVMFTDEEPGENFDFDRWAMHRSSSRYGTLLLGPPAPRPPTSVVVVWARGLPG